MQKRLDPRRILKLCSNSAKLGELTVAEEARSAQDTETRGELCPGGRAGAVAEEARSAQDTETTNVEILDGRAVWLQKRLDPRRILKPWVR